MKMTSFRWSAAVALALVLAVAPLTAQDTDVDVAEPDAPTKLIKMTSENFKWTPNVIRVTQGTRVTIEFQNYDAPHRFELKAYKLKVPLSEGKPAKVEFVADQAGTFKWKCGRPCGNGCPKMRGKLIVE